MRQELTRDAIITALRKMPADATIDDAIEWLVFLAKLEQRLTELDAGQGTHHTTPASSSVASSRPSSASSNFPNPVGSERNEQTLREVIVSRFRVVYRTRADTLEILTVFRGSRLFPGDL